MMENRAFSLPDMITREKNKSKRTLTYRKMISMLKDKDVDKSECGFLELEERYGEINQSSARLVQKIQIPATDSGDEINWLSWAPYNPNILAIAASSKSRRAPMFHESNVSYIWDLENPTEPSMTLSTYAMVSCLEHHDRCDHFLASGNMDGRVCFWDLRLSCKKPSLACDRKWNHKFPISALLWDAVDGLSHLVSAGKDGWVKTWDARNFRQPIETILVNEEGNFDKAAPITSIDYHSKYPDLLLIGNVLGEVYVCNRKPAIHAQKFVAKYTTDDGPVCAVQRNYTHPQFFLTTGELECRIWAEDFQQNCVLYTSPKTTQRFTAASWSPMHCSVFGAVTRDGRLIFWDALSQVEEPSVELQLCNETLRCFRIHDHGRIVAAADSSGKIYLVELSDNLVLEQTDDADMLLQVLQEETERERNYLRWQEQDKWPFDSMPEDTTFQESLEQAKKEFLSIIQEEQVQLVQKRKEREKAGIAALEAFKVYMSDDAKDSKIFGNEINYEPTLATCNDDSVNTSKETASVSQANNSLFKEHQNGNADAVFESILAKSSEIYGKGKATESGNFSGNDDTNEDDDDNDEEEEVGFMKEFVNDLNQKIDILLKSKDLYSKLHENIAQDNEEESEENKPVKNLTVETKDKYNSLAGGDGNTGYNSEEILEHYFDNNLEKIIEKFLFGDNPDASTTPNPALLKKLDMLKQLWNEKFESTDENIVNDISESSDKSKVSEETKEKDLLVDSVSTG